MKIRLLGTGAIYSKYNCASELIDDKILVYVGNFININLLYNKKSSKNKNGPTFQEVM